MATTKDLRNSIPASDKPEILSKINSHFFPDNERVLQSFLHLRGDITIQSCGEIIDMILEKNIPTFEIDEDGDDDVLVETPQEDVINLLITSSGGDMSAAFALISVIKASKIPVRTIAIGEAASAALCILMSGHQRVAAPYTSLMSHQFNTGSEGPYHVLKNIMQELDSYHSKMIRLYKECTQLDETYIRENLLSEKDCWMTPEEALENRFVDIVSDLS